MSNTDGSGIPTSTQPIGTDPDKLPISITQPWYRFLLNLWGRTGGAAGNASGVLDTITDVPGSLLGRFQDEWLGFSAGPGEVNMIPVLNEGNDPNILSLSELLDAEIGATPGMIAYRGAALWSALAPGADGTVLTLAGGLPSWAAGASGGATLIASGSVGTGTVLDIPNIPATYVHLALILKGVSHNAGANRNVMVQVSVDNGSSFDTTAANYRGAIWNAVNTIAANPLAAIGFGVSAAAAAAIDAVINIYNYQGGPWAMGETLTPAVGSASGQAGRIIYTGSTLNIDALRLLLSGTGNFDAGTYELYGVG